MFYGTCGASQGVLVVENWPANAGDTGDLGLLPGLGRPPGGGQGNPLHYSFLENPVDRGAWWATAHGVTQSHTRLKRLSMHGACEIFINIFTNLVIALKKYTFQLALLSLF